VIADGRAPRDGKFIEKLGTYNPLTHPATIEVDFDRAYHWVMCGAQPTDTARTILQREGIYMKKHLMGGVQKGALTEEQAAEKLAAWKEEKSRKLNDIKLEAINSARSVNKKRLEAETKVKQAKEAVLAEKRNAALAAEVARKAEAEAEAAKKTAVISGGTEVTEAVEIVGVTEISEVVEVAEIPEATETETATTEEPITEEAVTEEAPVAEETPAAE
jgi:small subunit ribosomal protein S16